MDKLRVIIGMFVAVCLFSSCKQSWNDPHQTEDAHANVGYSSFSEPPKTLDPAKAYSSDEILFIAQIYEPPLQYQYLKRPYELVPLTAQSLPEVHYLDAKNKLLPDNAPDKAVVYSVYDIYIKPDIKYQPHPAFAKDENGNFRYHHLSEDEIEDISSIYDLPNLGTRELVAEDYVYQIKRLADPRVQSPIYGLMSQYIVGFKAFNEELSRRVKQNVPIELRTVTLSGVDVVDRYHYRVKLLGKYPQFRYWLAMPFFSAMPWEVIEFFHQPGMDDVNLKIEWQPVGTGPYFLIQNNPNKQMVLLKNPNFRGEKFPTSGMPGDQEKGYLKNAGKMMPFINRYVYSLEKESIPRWNKFLQGYYGRSAISSDSFDQAIRIDASGNPDLSSELKEKGIRLQTVVTPTIFYWGFNMRDPVVGGFSERAIKLRQAITAALDVQEYISIFLNGRGVAAQGPIPPGIFGHEDDINPYSHQSIEQAKILLDEAGYAKGVDEKTGEPLVLNYDVTSASGPDDKARFDWMRKQFAKIGIQLNIRSTQYNRFQEKMRTGNAQIFSWGWHADYPDPENFLFLLYGPNGKVKSGGENAANYNNPEFNKLFEQMKSMSNTDDRKAIIQQMTDIVRHDSPWIFGVFPKEFVLTQSWYSPSKPNPLANNTLKYQQLDPELRYQLITHWNKPTYWPIAVLGGIILIGVFPVVIGYRRREHATIRSGER